MLDHLDRRNQREQDLLRLQHAQQVLAMTSGDNSRRGLLELITQLIERVVRSYRPFEKEEIQLEAQTKKVSTATNLWEQNYNLDLDDPAVQQRIDDVAQGLNALRVSTARAVQSGAL